MKVMTGRGTWMDMPPLNFDAAMADHAAETWGANCGPLALAAVMGLTPDGVRPHMGDFERKGYTNPTLMLAALDSLGVVYAKSALGDRAGGARCTYLGWPWYGLARIQWEGPWTKPGVPMRARYRYTHWVGVATKAINDVVIFDCNAMGCPTPAEPCDGWTTAQAWARIIVPAILAAGYPRADGQWHITHAIEVRPYERRAAA